MLYDLRFVLRQLRRCPGFTFVAIATLALGIGANTAIFSVINSALLQPLAYDQPDQLVEFWSTTRTSSTPWPGVTAPQFTYWRDNATSFESIAITGDQSGRQTRNLIEDGHAERVTGAEVSASYLHVLRIRPKLGRDFAPGADELGGKNNVVILSHEWWQTRFGGDPALIGRTINLSGSRYEVIGVLSPHALVRDEINFLIPFVLGDPKYAGLLNPQIAWARVSARLNPGVTLAQAEQEAKALTERYYATITHDPSFPLPVFVRPLQEGFTSGSRTSLLMLLGAVSLVLLIACANVANLMLVRAGARHREMAVRMALGAGAGRLVRLVLTESVLVSLLGGAVGVVAAFWGMDLLTRLTSSILPTMLRPVMDLRVLMFSLVLAGGSGVLFGLIPALRVCHPNVNRDLKASARGSSSTGRLRTQSLLIVSEVALTVTLLITAGLLLRSFARVLAADPGFNAQGALVCDLSITRKDFRFLQFQSEVIRRIEALPGVEAAGTVSHLPLSGTSWAENVWLPGQPAEDPGLDSLKDHVGGHYFRSLGIDLVAGRLLNAHDSASDAAPVTVINKRLADELMPGENPIGKTIQLKETVNLKYEVVGVVSNVHHEHVDQPARRHFYLPLVRDWAAGGLIVRASVEPLSLVKGIRDVVAAIDPDHGVSNFRTLEHLVSHSVRQRRLTLALLGSFAIVAVGLACLGIYGVLAYTVGLRQREFGVRIALGATLSGLVALVMRNGMRMVLLGVGIGIGAALVAARLMASLLFEVSAYDPAVFVVVPLLIIAVATLACWLPARQAAQVDPIEALSAE